MTQDHKILNNQGEHVADMVEEVVPASPGRMLRDARENHGLSQQQVANKLNFRKTLVEEIELDKFDLNIPEAFNRGYLRNYAKLVNIAQEDVLNSYDQLGVAQRQCAKMQSFSKGTEKQAEHNMLMWVTYLILAVLVTATVVWWFQRPSEQPEPIAVDTVATSAGETIATAQANLSEQTPPSSDNRSLITAQQATNTRVANSTENVDTTVEVNEPASEKLSGLTTTIQSDSQPVSANTDQANEVTTAIANVVFTFSGDCWVNIYDATGERIAWGVKKSGYIMRISGQAPFSITLGKPELVQIDYNDAAVDMSSFNAGNIAKFSLPLTP